MTSSPNSPQAIATLSLQTVKTHEHHLEISFLADDFGFSTKVLYPDVSFSQLRQRYSGSTVDRVVAHIAFLEGMKFCSLFPQFYDISAIASHLFPESLTLFQNIYRGVFAQNLYENQYWDYSGVEFVCDRTQFTDSSPARIGGDNETILTGCGGGKDSILMMKMLESSDLPFASLQMAHSVYGQADLQHKLIGDTLKNVRPQRQHQFTVFDDFVDEVWLEQYFPHLAGITIPETPVFIFEAIPIMMAFGYRYLTLGHERSANEPNLYSAELGRSVNHQWGKGYEAEQILHDFLNNHLFEDLAYYSTLQPLHDYRIFKNLTRYPEVLPNTHSCNVKKPWCKKCPKCAYVWLGYMAFFEKSLVDSIFNKNLFDDDDLLPIYREMLGLADRKSFECIGEFDEAKLMMKRCMEKGLTGKALSMFETQVLSDRSIDWQALEAKYDRVYEDRAIPDWIFAKMQGQL